LNRRHKSGVIENEAAVTKLAEVRVRGMVGFLGRVGGCGLVLAFVTGSPAAFGQYAPPADANGITHPSIVENFANNGDPYGVRKKLADYGITYYFIYTNDVLSNVAGGNKRGTIDQGKLEDQLTINLEKLAGLKDLTFYTNAFQIYNTGRIRRDYVGSINTIAAIEATPAVRLSELWLEQKFFGGNISLKAGQLAVDSEFFYSDLSTMFLQSDWPTIGAQNLPSGGPAYPLSTPGARLKFDYGSSASFLFAIFNGDPAGACPGNDPDTCNRYGVNFRMRDPAFMIGEAQFRTNSGAHDTGLATIFKIGGWQHLGLFGDQANPGLARRGDYGIYTVIDQQLWRPAGAAPDKGISVFTRASISPADRNQISGEIDGGVVFAGLLPSRPDDKFGASVIYSRFSHDIRANPMNQLAPGIPGSYPDYETNLEVTYVAQIVPGWTVQPVYTRIWHPSGRPGRDADVIGVRSILYY
jgi:porin